MKNKTALILLGMFVLFIIASSAAADDGSVSKDNQFRQPYPVPMLYPIGPGPNPNSNPGPYNPPEPPGNPQPQPNPNNNPGPYNPPEPPGNPQPRPNPNSNPGPYNPPEPPGKPQPQPNPNKPYQPYGQPQEPYESPFPPAERFPQPNSPYSPDGYYYGGQYFYPISIYNDTNPYYSQPVYPYNQYNVQVNKQYNANGSVCLNWTIRNVTNEDWGKTNVDIKCISGCYLLTNPNRILWDLPYTVYRNGILSFTVNIWEPGYSENMTFAIVSGSKTIYSFNVSIN